MAKYEVLKRAIHGVKVGDTIELSDNDAKARGKKYVKPAKKEKAEVKKQEKVEDKAVEKASNKSVE